MKMLRRQEGYTLLLVLVLVVLLLMVTASFTVASMNQKKQIDKTDEAIVATSLAEMGAEYYQLHITDLVKKEYNNARTDFQSIIDTNEPNQIKIKKINDRINDINDNLQLALHILNTNSIKRTINNSDAYYILEDANLDNTESKINYVVAGNTGLETSTLNKTIEATLILPAISPFNPSSTPSDNVSNVNPEVILPTFSAVYNQDLENCSSVTLDISCKLSSANQVFSSTVNSKLHSPFTNLSVSGTHQNSSIIFKNNLSQTNNIDRSIKGLSILVNGTANFNNVMNGDNLYIFAQEDLILKNINNQFNSTLISLNTLEIKEPFSSSQINLLAKRIILKNINSPSSNSQSGTIKATESVTINESIDGDKLEIITHDLTLKGNVNNGIKLIVSGKLFAPNRITIGLRSDIYINEVDDTNSNEITFSGNNRNNSSIVCINTPTIEGISRLKATGNTKIHVNGPKQGKMPNASHFIYHDNNQAFLNECGHVQPTTPSPELEIPDVLPNVNELEIFKIKYN